MLIIVVKNRIATVAIIAHTHLDFDILHKGHCLAGAGYNYQAVLCMEMFDS